MKAIIIFLPIVVLAGMMISGQDALLAAPVAVVAAVAIAMLTEKVKFQECIDAATKSVGNIIVALFILMIAVVSMLVLTLTGALFYA